MKNTKVFLVDDHAALRDGLAGLINGFDKFESAGVAADGKEAIAALENGVDPDIMLLDLKMPVMDGYAVAEWLAEEQPRVKVLVLTMGVEKSKLNRLLAAGVKGIINKDTGREELKQALETVARGEDYYSNSVTREMAALYRPKEIKNANHELNETEKAFIRLCASDLTYKEICYKMNMTKNAIELLRTNLFAALGMKNRTALALFAVKNGILNLDSEEISL